MDASYLDWTFIPLVLKQSSNYFLSYIYPYRYYCATCNQIKAGFPHVYFSNTQLHSTLYIYYKLFSMWPLGTVQDLNDQSTKYSNFYFYSRKLWGFKSGDGSVYKYFAIRIRQKNTGLNRFNLRLKIMTITIVVEEA